MPETTIRISVVQFDQEDQYLNASLEDNRTIVSSNTSVTEGSTIHSQQPTRLDRLLRGSLSDSGYISEKKNQEIKFDDQEFTSNEDPYRWVILFSGFLAQAISMCTLSSVMQDYFDREVFKGSVDSTELSFVGTIGFSFCGLMGPVTPLFMSLVGARWLLFFGTILISAGLILASFSTQVWQLYITQSVMHGMGAALLYIVSMSISPQWFVKRRGFAMGVMVSGSGVGGLIMPFVMTSLNESLGGAWCYRVLGIITFVISLLSTLLLREKKSKLPGNATKKFQLANMMDMSICKDSNFIIWCIVGNLSMLSYFIPAFYLPSHATKIGLKPSQGSTLVAVFSAVNVLGRIFSGFLGDHVGVVNTNIMFLFVCGLSSLFIWTFANSFITLLIFILIYGFMSGAVFSLSARFGPSLAGAIQTATNKHLFFSQQMFTGLAFITTKDVGKGMIEECIQ
ncbi:major facilitator superfamily domain-containing protein [Gilbertella persicaria]|uniref:major facilitator superfamily domain-containing protein n=1 Tax=Gilbertella persicaria TaxID=101096 RepID=UPI002220D2A2|nr:major facilitator superfamily domain-containing protein [Gilbertella persicaria]KAI8087855.1 major facilitator superfamily domain-containing protein [Gilbertella persicaria]